MKKYRVLRCSAMLAVFSGMCGRPSVELELQSGRLLASPPSVPDLPRNRVASATLPLVITHHCHYLDW